MKRYKYKILILTGAALALCIPIRFSSVHVEALKAPFVGILEYNFTYKINYLLLGSTHLILYIRRTFYRQGYTDQDGLEI